MFGLTDPYLSYCFDEVCGVIMAEIEAGNEPQFKTKYKSFSDLYKKYN